MGAVCSSSASEAAGSSVAMYALYGYSWFRGCCARFRFEAGVPVTRCGAVCGGPAIPPDAAFVDQQEFEQNLTEVSERRTGEGRDDGAKERDPCLRLPVTDQPCESAHDSFSAFGRRCSPRPAQRHPGRIAA